MTVLGFALRWGPWTGAIRNLSAAKRRMTSGNVLVVAGDKVINPKVIRQLLTAHEQSKAENKYDTRGLEAAYLAGGQARQAKEILDSIKAYEALVTRDFASIDPIGLTALVELDADGSHSTYFIGPRSGGLEITHRRKEIMVITPQSPLGQNLMGRKAGQRWAAKLGGSTVKSHIASVS